MDRKITPSGEKETREYLPDLTRYQAPAAMDRLAGLTCLGYGSLAHRTAPTERLAPDSYRPGWHDNGLPPHLHVIPRFDDEPMADHGVRSGIKDPANRRPDPWRPGTGRHLARS